MRPHNTVAMKKTLALLLLLAGLSGEVRAETLIWNGSGNDMTWNTEDGNWLLNGAHAVYANDNDVEFGDTGNGYVALSGELSPTSVLVDSDKYYFFCNDIGEGHKLTGTMQLTKEGGGTLTIETANDYTGGTIINGGTLVLGNDSALGQGAITLKSGTLDLGHCTLSGNEITVTGHGTISGEVDTSAVGIAGHATAEFTAPVSTEDVRFSAAQGETVKVINNGDTLIKYDGDYLTLGSNVEVQAKTLDVITNQPIVMVTHPFDVDEITFHTPATTLGLADAELLDLNTLTMLEGTNLILTYAAEDRSNHYGTVTIKDALNAGSASMVASLMFKDGDLQDGLTPLLNVNGGGDCALYLSDQFGIAEGTLVTLDPATIAALENLADGESLDLIREYFLEQELTYFGDYDGMAYDQLFSREGGVLGDYTVYANAGAFGLTKGRKIPEPTTGSLGLLALAGLAARRRRK